MTRFGRAFIIMTLGFALAVGYDDAASKIFIRNSWGLEWGAGGYGSLPYAYVLSPNLADDFWTIRTVE